MQLSQHVHLIDGVTGANSYLYVDTEVIVVIDTGMPGNAERIIQYLQSLNAKPELIKSIILTHDDVDHSGSAAELREISGAKIAIHAMDADRVAGRKKIKDVKGIHGAFFSFTFSFISFNTFEPDLKLQDNDSVDSLRIIHTPGHTSRSICIYKENEAIFVGDTLRADKDGRLKLPPTFLTENMQQTKESIKKITSFNLSYSMLLPGHGKPVTSEASIKLQDFVTKELSS